MSISSTRNELLTYIKPFHIGTGCRPDERQMERLETLIRDLARANPSPQITDAFPQLAGLWKCVFTSSRFVLGLDQLRIARLSAVYQYVVIQAGELAGHYFNIGEMSRKSRVCGACGEYALIRPSHEEPDRIDVAYQWFYAAVRVWSPYEGSHDLADRLENGRVPRRIRVPFQKVGWQRHAYLDNALRVVFGSEGGIFILVRQPHSKGGAEIVKTTLGT